MAIKSLLVIGFAASSWWLIAAEPASPPSDQAERHKPLPTYYGMIGVSDQQRTKLYAIQDSYEEKLEALRTQLKQLIRERDQKMETLLTPGQKLRLKELRAAAKLRTEQPSPPAPGEAKPGNP